MWGIAGLFHPFFDACQEANKAHVVLTGDSAPHGLAGSLAPTRTEPDHVRQA
jgi:hypothetical protein